MTRLLNDVKGSAVRATDGEIGKVTDYYFDDEQWAVRYLVVDVGNLVIGGYVLISPISLAKADWDGRRIELNIDRERVKKSPTTDILRPVSRQYEIDYYRYYGYPSYWLGTGVWGAEATPGALGGITPAAVAGPAPATPAQADVRETVGTVDSRLRSAKEVAGYHIKATDREMGHIDDFLLNPDTWVIDSILIDTSNWPGGKWVVVPRERLQRVDWATKRIFVNMTSQEVRNSPEFSESTVTRRL